MEKKSGMKTLKDIQLDMSELYDNVKDGSTELKVASELANIAGKFLKAEQLKLAREIFSSGRSRLLTNGAEAERLLTAE